jgi:hypothetical protein
VQLFDFQKRILFEMLHRTLRNRSSVFVIVCECRCFHGMVHSPIGTLT